MNYSCVCTNNTSLCISQLWFLLNIKCICIIYLNKSNASLYILWITGNYFPTKSNIIFITIMTLHDYLLQLKCYSSKGNYFNLCQNFVIWLFSFLYIFINMHEYVENCKRVYFLYVFLLKIDIAIEYGYKIIRILLSLKKPYYLIVYWCKNIKICKRVYNLSKVIFPIN